MDDSTKRTSEGGASEKSKGKSVAGDSPPSMRVDTRRSSVPNRKSSGGASLSKNVPSKSKAETSGRRSNRGLQPRMTQDDGARRNTSDVAATHTRRSVMAPRKSKRLTMLENDEGPTSSNYETDNTTEFEMNDEYSAFGESEEGFRYGPDMGDEFDEEEEEEVDLLAAAEKAANATTRALMLAEAWEKISADIRRTFDTPSRVFKLRGYHSEPDLTIPFEEKFEIRVSSGEGDKGESNLIKQKFVSLEDIVQMSGKEHPTLVRGILSELFLKNLALSDKLVCSWLELAEMERSRFSYFDELFAMGYVVDSLEVTAPPPKGDEYATTNKSKSDYFIAADEKHYKKKVDYGRVVLKTKHVYTGGFQDWYFEGDGQYSWEDGTVYYGKFSRGEMHGPGRLQWPDGGIYEGHFTKGIRTGWGVYSSGDGQTFAGEWLDGLPTGHGKMWYDPEDDDNDYYEGQWEKGLPQGIGTRQYATGDRYVGNWVDGLRNGYGIMVWLKERQVYKGQWVDGVPNGFGKHIWYLERTANNSFPTRHVYHGTWVNGMREGIGKMIYPCGSVYEGRWHSGQRHGKGMFINPAGDILVGLFRTGAIVGGSEVPLHAPTYDCDFGGLIEWLTERFNLPVLEGSTDEDWLHVITKQHLPQIRRLYHRAGEFSQKYGNHGLYPAYLKKLRPASQVKKDDGQIALHRNYSRDDEPEHMKGKVEKPESLDGVNPVTRFGLWLMMKDCDNLLDDVTMAFYDTVWCDTPPLSFQTRHNPFEPVYLWQFIQSMIVSAVAYFIEIPKIRQQQEQDESNEEQTNPGSEKKDSISDDGKEHNRKLSNESNDALKQVDSRKSRWRKKGKKDADKDKEKDKKGNKKKDEEEKLETKKSKGRKSLAVISGDKLEGPKARKSLAPTVLSGRDSLNGSNQEEKIDKRKTKNSMINPTDEDRKSLGKDMETILENEEIQMESEPDEEEGEDELEQEEFDTDPFEVEEGSEETGEGRKSKKSVILPEEPEEPEPDEPVPAIAPDASISECFETFLLKKLLPTLKRDPGKNLPVVPHPLPALVDMFEAFKAVKDREIIKGLEFMQSTLPHLYPEASLDEFAMSRRSTEVLTVGTIDFDMDDDDMQPEDEDAQVETPDNVQQEVMESEYLGVQAQNSEAAMQMLHLIEKAAPTNNEDADDEEDCEPHSTIVGMGRSVEQARATIFGGQQAKLVSSEESATEFITEGNPFAEEELAPEPFLWADDYKCLPVPKKNPTNVDMTDVLNVFRQLYPNIHLGTQDKDLSFELIFCDWLWCTSLLAKISTEREFKEAWKSKEIQRPITNPQSLGVYAHYIKQIRNNPFLSGIPPQIQPKLKESEEPKKSVKF